MFPPGPAKETVQYSACVRPPSATTELRIHRGRDVDVYKLQRHRRLLCASPFPAVDLIWPPFHGGPKWTRRGRIICHGIPPLHPCGARDRTTCQRRERTTQFAVQKYSQINVFHGESKVCLMQHTCLLQTSVLCLTFSVSNNS